MSDSNTPSTKRAEMRTTSTAPDRDARNGAESMTAQRGQNATGAPGNGGVLDRVRQSATAQLSQQKDRGIDALGSVAQVVRSTTQRLRDEKHETIARYVDQAVDRVDTWSRQLKDKNVDELLTDVQRLARRQPAVFIGSAFALGVLGARFLKSSRRDENGASGGEWQRAQEQSRALNLGEEAEVAFAANEVAVPDVSAAGPSARASVGDNAGAGSGRSRKSNSRTERS
jgi:hypothetical protein